MHCIHCGKRAVESDKFCAGCGEKIQRPQSEEQRFERLASAPPISETSEASGDLIADALPDGDRQADGPVDSSLEQPQSTVDMDGDDLVPSVPSLSTSQSRKAMGFWDAVRHCLSHYGSFSGRASRSEFWKFWLFCALWTFGGAIALEPLGAVDAQPYWIVVSFTGLVLPSQAVCIRRLHDVGYSGWFWWMHLFLIGSYFIFTKCIQRSDEGDNKYGPSPHQLAQDSSVNESEKTDN